MNCKNYESVTLSYVHDHTCLCKSKQHLVDWWRAMESHVTHPISTPQSFDVRGGTSDFVSLKIEFAWNAVSQE